MFVVVPTTTTTTSTTTSSNRYSSAVYTGCGKSALIKMQSVRKLFYYTIFCDELFKILYHFYCCFRTILHIFYNKPLLMVRVY